MTRPATPTSTRQRVVVLTFPSAAEAEQFDAAWERFDPSVVTEVIRVAARNDPQPLLDELRETGWEWLDGGPLPSGSWMIRLRNAERRKDAAATGPTLIDALRAVRDIARAQ